MLAIERRNEILTTLQKEQRVIVSELSQKYKVTEETIRRDLEKLENGGFVKKTYGGAIFKQNINFELPFKVRERSNKEAKHMIAKKIAAYIEDGDSIMLDSSSSAVAVAKHLKHKKKLTIITNSVEILLEFAEFEHIRVISTGGMLRESSLSLVGPNAIMTIRNFNVDKAVFSCKGIHLVKGITESGEVEAEIKKAMMASAKEIILAVDSSKFDFVSFAKIADIQNIHAVATNETPVKKWTDYFEENKIHII